MPTPTYTALANITLGSSASTITFSSIPATYRDLVIVANASASETNQFSFRINGDTGSNYSYVYAIGFSGGTQSIGETTTAGRIGNIFTSIGTHILNIMDYSATDKHKTLLARSGDATGSQAWMLANRWASTSALTSIQFYCLSGATLSAGTTFALYAIAS